jgi:hypothetical protein
MQTEQGRLLYGNLTGTCRKEDDMTKGGLRGTGVQMGQKEAGLPGSPKKTSSSDTD